jgi:conjugal transfer pilus assembly protein TraU
MVLLALFIGHANAQVKCVGKWVEIGDICWECIFPIAVMGITIYQGQYEDFYTGASDECSCTYGEIELQGVNIAYWEPIRLMESVRHPACFPLLNGMAIDLGEYSQNHGHLKRNSPNGQTTGHSFYQVHWYTNPILYELAEIVNFSCLDINKGMDLEFITEYDPLWHDSEDTFILNPDAALFTSVVASIACAVDCVMATLYLPSEFLFWCAGCQGRMFPLTGWIAGHIGGIQASALLAQRFTNKLHRQGLMRAAWGKPGQCGQYPMPIMDARAYKMQMVWPFRTTKEIDGRCCYPYGRTTQIWQIGKTVPAREDYGWQIFQRKDCCYPARLF